MSKAVGRVYTQYNAKDVWISVQNDEKNTEGIFE